MSSRPSSTPARTLPKPTPETQHFWDGCKAGELRLQRCRACAQSYFPPRPFCPKCGGREVEAYAASGRATLYSYVINHRPRPDIGTEPHSIAVVTLEEGPRMMTNIVGCPQTPEALRLDMPLYGLEDLGFCQPGEAKDFFRERRTAPPSEGKKGGALPMNTNGGGLSYTHSGMYGMYALQESVRQMRGTAPAQVEGAQVSVCHGVGNMFSAAGTVILTNQA